jgi:hypothetical protein
MLGDRASHPPFDREPSLFLLKDNVPMDMRLKIAQRCVYPQG